MDNQMCLTFHEYVFLPSFKKDAGGEKGRGRDRGEWELLTHVESIPSVFLTETWVSPK